mgnify:CR=1 FL=1
MRAVYPAFTLAMVVASGLCLRHALGDREARATRSGSQRAGGEASASRHASREDLALYAAALVYGLLLEKATVIAFDAYSYPASEYLVAPLGIPVAIALGWSAVIYAGVATARGLGVPRVSLPGFVALYALHVDLSMDAVAIRVPYWVWHDPGPWFGVPLGNFFGWFCVAALLPAWFLGLRRRVRNVWLRGGLAVGLSVASLVPLLEAWTTLTWETPLAKVAVLVGGGVLALALLVRHRPAFHGRPAPHALAATLVFHVFFLGLLVVEGYYRPRPWLLAVAVGMLATGLAVHWLPAAPKRTRDPGR